MDSPSNMSEGTEKYIWLRYTTQFTMDARTHTIEMGIPMPLGASAETRELLLCEAESGMDQLAHHVEQRIDQMLGSTRTRQTCTSTISLAIKACYQQQTSFDGSLPNRCFTLAGTTSPLSGTRNGIRATCLTKR